MCRALGLGAAVGCGPVERCIDVERVQPVEGAAAIYLFRARCPEGAASTALHERSPRRAAREELQPQGNLSKKCSVS